MWKYISEYKEKVDSGEIITSKYVVLLLQIIVSGLESGVYVFREDMADDAIEWIQEHCFHTMGFLAPGPFVLELWQKVVLACLFGIYDPKTGKRQFRELLLVVARKNGKSLFAAAIAKYVLYKYGGYGARIYCTAPKLDQADIIYDNVWKMIQLDPEWQAEEIAIKDSIEGHNRKTYDDSGHAKRKIKGITIEETNSVMKKVAFSDRKSDGYDPSLAICDEIASWSGMRGLKQYEVWKSAGGAREMGDTPTIIISCTTSGYEDESIYDELVKRSTRFLYGESDEQRLLPFIYMIDDPEKWDDLTELHKSNPNMGVSVSEEYLREEIAIAHGSLSKKAEFLTKYCNIKQNSSLAWLEASVVESMSGEPLSLDDFRGSYCVAGIDLSQTTDLTACIVIVEKNGELYVFGKFWLPAEKIDEATQRDGVPYNIYIQRGILEPSGDNFVDYHDCFNYLRDLVENYEILPLMVGYDRYSAQYLIQDLNGYGFRCDDVYQGENLWIVLQEMEGLFKDGVVHIGDNDLLKIHLLNSAIKMSVERGKGKLIKLNPAAHIDGCAALADAFTVRQKWYGEIGERLRNE